MTEHFARDYVDRCTTDLQRRARHLTRPPVADSFALALHRSVSALLHQELTRLLHRDRSALPVALQSEFGKWQADAAPSTLTAVVRLRASQWRSTVAELLQRLERDWRAISRGLHVAEDARVTDISVPLGDPHNQGRSVFKIGFDDGRTIVYKPRQVGTEFTFGRVVQWLRERQCEPDLTSCVVVPRDGYGWMDCVTHATCVTLDEGEAYYQRQGAFLSLFYLLGGSDGIGENCIISRDHPVWVDTECMCTPGLPQKRPRRKLPDWVYDSILTTGLVFWANQTGVPARRFAALNETCFATRDEAFNDRAVLKDRFLGAVQMGFGKAYDGILARRPEWKAPTGPLSWWRHQAVRLIPRPTELYVALSDALLMAPRRMSSVVRRHVERALADGRADARWPSAVVRADVYALSRGDVPLWSVSPCGRRLWEAAGATTGDIADETGFDRVRSRTARLGDADREHQLWLIDTHLRIPDLA